MEQKTSIMLIFLSIMLKMILIRASENAEFTSREPVSNIESIQQQISAQFSNFIAENNFYGSQAAILLGSKLVYTEGKGVINHLPIDATTSLPILDLSKAFTVVAILQLLEERSLSLNETVFGEGDLLQDFLDPLYVTNPDPRLYDITIEHLLTHTAGWDETKQTVLDPMINPILLSLGYNVPNIIEEMGAQNYFDQYTIIQYMVSQKLSFSPGSKFVHSNLGYSILGRVVEAAAGEAYESYVKKNILEVCGMHHTGIATSSRQITKIIKNVYKSGLNAEADDEDNEGITLMNPYILDSTLGWYSNIYDVARFHVALFEADDEILLKRRKVNIAISLIPELSKHYQYTWIGQGSNSHNRGQASHDRQLGMNVFFYRESGFDISPEENNHGSNQLEEVKSFIFIGFTHQHRRRQYFLQNEILTIDLSQLVENKFIDDLTDLKLTTDSQTALLKTHLPRNDITIYSNAMKIAGFWPLWFQGYIHNEKVYYMAIFLKARRSHQLSYMVTSSLSKAKMLRYVAENARNRYQVSFVKSFQSASPPGDQIEHLLIMSRSHSPRFVMFNFHTRMRVYNNTAIHASAEGFQPSMQSIQKHRGRKYVSYILQKPHSLTKQYKSLSVHELQFETTNNALGGYYLSYIDMYRGSRGNPHFSCIFTKSSHTPVWALQPDIAADEFIQESITWTSAGYLPKFIIPYSKQHSLHYLVYWQILS